MARKRPLVTLACVLAAAAPLPAVAQSAVDECTALNEVRYDTPEGATGAQYVGVAGACRAVEDPEAEIEVTPIGGQDAGGSSGGPATPTTSSTPAPAGEQAPTPRPREGVPPSDGGTGTTVRTTTTPTRPVPPKDAARIDGDASAEVQVAQALSAADDTHAAFAAPSSAVSMQVVLPLLAALGLVGAAIGLRRRGL